MVIIEKRTCAPSVGDMWISKHLVVGNMVLCQQNVVTECQSGTVIWRVLKNTNTVPGESEDWKINKARHVLYTPKVLQIELEI